MKRVATGVALGLSIFVGSLTMGSTANAYVLVNRASPGYGGGAGPIYCAGVAAGNVNTDGTQIIIWPCIAGAQDQQWTEVPLNDTWFSLRNGSNSNQCMGVAAGGVNNGAQMVAWHFYGAGNQYWRKDPSSHPGCYYFTNMGSQLLLGVKGGSMSRGTPLMQWEILTGHLDQEWCMSDGMPRRGPASR